MDNSGYEADIKEKRLDNLESGVNGHASRPSFVDLNRAASVTKDEEQITFTWENIMVKTKPTGRSILKKSEPVPSKTLVDKTSGYVRPGELVAIMGASGAGKSTLLNALTFRYSGNLDVSGTRYVNGNPVSPNSLTAVSAYIMQDDVFIGSLTVREHLEFMSKVRMDKSVSKKEKEERVNAVIKELGLSKSQNTVIGSPGRVKGISGGESKRLAFASEVLTNPPLLFCDEPTSGLDAFMAQNVIGVLRSLTQQGKSIVCTIHQPSSEVFALFDRVLLMAEGRLAYLGNIDRCFTFFSNCGYPCPDKYNPSDHYVHTLAIVPGDEDDCRKRVHAITSQFKESSEGHEIQQVVEYEKSHAKLHPKIKEEKKRASPYRASWWTQFWALLWRAWLSSLKDSQIMIVNLGQTIVMGSLIGIVFMDQDYDQAGVPNIVGAMFFTLVCVSYVYQFSVINSFCAEMPVFLREHYNGAYRVETYYITKQLAELPIFLVLPVILGSIIYWMVGFNDDVERFAIFLAIIVLLTQVVTGWGYLISTVTGDVQLALAIAPALMIPIMMFAGFFINLDTVPSWLSWIQYISWFFYANEALLVNQWDTIDEIECDAQVGIACQFNDGQDVLNFYSMDADRFVLDVMMLLALFVAFRIMGLLALFARTYQKR